MLEELKEQVYQANLELPRRGLVLYTWGNVSGIDREKGLVVIKPSGVEYDDLKPQDLVVLDLAGNVVEGDLNPSSDTKTHLELYRVFPQIGGVVHTHSTYAVAWAQAGEDIPCYGTTHADYFYGPVPCARGLTATEVEEGYEESTGKVIVETFQQQGLDPVAVPGVLCRNHGPFTWGKNAAQAVYHAAVLEEMAKMALLTRQVNPSAAPAPQYVQDFTRFLSMGFTSFHCLLERKFCQEQTELLPRLCRGLFWEFQMYITRSIIIFYYVHNRPFLPQERFGLLFCQTSFV